VCLDSCSRARTQKSINQDKFNVTLRILDGDRRGQTLDAVDYEDVSKAAD
jgi:hypothetical protein